MSAMGDSNPNTNANLDINLPCLTTSLSEVTSKRKKRISGVWDHFTKIPKVDGGKPDRAKCNYCAKDFGCESSQGTSTLKRHMDKCTRYYKEKQQVLALSASSEQGGTAISRWKFDLDLFRRELARLVIVEELPFKFVECEGFINFCKVLQPKFNPISRTTVAKDCLELYMNEKRKIKEVLQRSAHRVCLTIDMWTSIQNIGYMCLTIYYIDREWNLQKKIINFCAIPFPHTGEGIANEVQSCLLAWGLEKVCTITVDNCSLNDVAIRSLRRSLHKKNSLLLEGEFLHMRCCAHVLNLIVRDVIEDAKTSWIRIRNVVKYVISLPTRQQKFKMCVEKEKISCEKTLCLDVCTHWNSTFLMLQIALEFQKAFERLEDLDINFKKELKDGMPTEDDWEKAKVLCKLLERFYNSTKKLSEPLCVTSNVYFHEVYAIEVFLMQCVRSQNTCLRDMALKMKEKYDKYWGNIDRVNIMLLVAVVLDPRYKLKYLEFCYSKIHPTDNVMRLIERVILAFDRLLKHYQSIEMIPDVPPVQLNQSGDKSMIELLDEQNVEFQRIQDEYRRQVEEENIQYGSEFDRYLLECTEKDVNFNILYWWKVNGSRFPILSQIARDILAIPVSAVASDSAFSSGEQVLDQFRSSLTPKLVECLICTKDWLTSSSTPIEVEESLEEFEEVESIIGEGAGTD
ncbi:zinc finger BED domain-containing protein RICESLEEPER 2-like isoform X2 [Tasmannia lanceolata]|uniref:zinc finger BED domain-containing protein RICESLEEPER 2-like isoform X2 n=1 Tax=Tasmannia lanceolata TaxID=3420 RepID=UPI0040645B35